MWYVSPMLMAVVSCTAGALMYNHTKWVGGLVPDRFATTSASMSPMAMGVGAAVGLPVVTWMHISGAVKQHFISAGRHFI
jgi:hypothetical protein